MKVLATESRRHRGKAFSLLRDSVAIFFHGKDTEEKIFSLLRVFVPPWQTMICWTGIEMWKLFQDNSLAFAERPERCTVDCLSDRPLFANPNDVPNGAYRANVFYPNRPHHCRL